MYVSVCLKRSKILVSWAYLSSILDCRFNCHKRCASKVPKDCLGEVTFNGGKMRNISAFDALVFEYFACFYFTFLFFFSPEIVDNYKIYSQSSFGGVDFT